MSYENLQGAISKWSRETFGGSTEQVATKMDAEYSELQGAIHEYVAWAGVAEPESEEAEEVVKEAADVLFMLFQLVENVGGDLLAETQKKFEINRARKWELQEDGTYQHVKAAD